MTVSEWILNGTSAQSFNTVPVTLVHAGKHRTEDKLKTLTIQNPEKADNVKHGRTKLAWFSRLL